MTTGAKQSILQRVRQANGGPTDSVSAHAAWDILPRQYRHTPQASGEELLDLFMDRLRDYDAEVVRSSAEQVGEAIAARLRSRGKLRVLVPDGLPDAYLPEGFDFVPDGGMEPQALDQYDSVLTASTLGIAETGTIVLQAGPGQGRRAITLVPDYHLCVVRAESVVATVPEAMAHLQATATLATTFVSGPSATADIEMTRIKGVHGPRTLDIILLCCVPP